MECDALVRALKNCDFLYAHLRVKSNENVTEGAVLRTVPSNENVTKTDLLLSVILAVSTSSGSPLWAEMVLP